MRTKLRSVLGSVLFFALAPGIVAGWVPYLVSGWRLQEAFFGLTTVRITGGCLVLIGLAGLIDCFARFALQGEGTPAPVAPTRRLVVSGLYRHVRNPMYVAVVSIILGQALVLGSVPLLVYAAIVWLTTHVFVLVYEEPTLRKQFGESFRRYESAVKRWWPRLRPWQGDATAPPDGGHDRRSWQ